MDLDQRIDSNHLDSIYACSYSHPSLTVFGVNINTLDMIGWILLYLSGALVLFASNTISRCPTLNELIPPFPLLSLSSGYTSSEIRIESESDGTKFGPMLSSELIDLTAGKSALLETRNYVQTVLYTDSSIDTSYFYKAAECRVVHPDDLSEKRGLWTATMFVGSGEKRRVLRFFGVAALWLNAESARKNYSRLSGEEASLKQFYQPAHRWSVTDTENKCLMHLYFIDRGFGERFNSCELSLIEVEDSNTGKIVHTINILRMEKAINAQLKEKYLEVPVGFGCRSEKADQKLHAKSYEDTSVQFRQKYAHSSFRFEFEVTATSFSSLLTEIEKPKSSTIFIEYASNEVGGKAQYLELFRQRSSDVNSKIIYHNLFKMAYDIGLSTGKCSMVSFDGEQNVLEVNFPNGLSLSDFRSFIGTILNPEEQYYHIKTTNDGKYIYEATKVLQSSGELLRIVQVYVNQGETGVEAHLKEVILITINQSKKIISQTIRFNLMKAEILTQASQLAEIFDVSEECYLNNDQMHYNRDFAWFKVSYPLPIPTIKRMIPYRNALKAHIYDQFLDKGHLGVFRVPKMELVFGESEIVIRALLLDIPRLMLKKFKPFRKLHMTDNTKEQLDQLATDLEHCENLCRLSLCQIMSYCEDSHECVISSNSYFYNSTEFVFETDNSCNTYRPTLSNSGEQLELHETTLHRVLAKLQHDNYDSTVIPAPPTNIFTSEGELDESEQRDELKKYLDEVENYFQQNMESIPMMSFVVDLEEHFFVLMPGKFELEEDPMEELHLIPKQEVDNLMERDKAPAFHRGLISHRYLKKVLQLPEHPDNQLINGLNYDQCAMTCVDLKCSSFSYCDKFKECLITDMYNLTDANEFIQQDRECFIAQRDFLSKFNKLSYAIHSADQYQQVSKSTNAAECAHLCMIEDSFKCLSFDYCLDEQGQALCFFFDNRLVTRHRLLSNSSDSSDDQSQMRPSADTCDHYSRSYLADFERLVHRQLKQSHMDSLKTTTTAGLSVDKCAELCLKEKNDCSAFQFCINLETSSKSTDSAFQSCQTIESKPRVNKAEELFEFSDNCHIFSLSSNSGELQVQELALAALLPSGDPSTALESTGSTGPTLGQALVLYLMLGLVSCGLVSGFVVAYHINLTFNQLVKRLARLPEPWLH